MSVNSIINRRKNYSSDSVASTARLIIVTHITLIYRFKKNVCVICIINNWLENFYQALTGESGARNVIVTEAGFSKKLSLSLPTLTVSPPFKDVDEIPGARLPDDRRVPSFCDALTDSPV